MGSFLWYCEKCSFEKAHLELILGFSMGQCLIDKEGRSVFCFHVCVALIRFYLLHCLGWGSHVELNSSCVTALPVAISPTAAAAAGSEQTASALPGAIVTAIVFLSALLSVRLSGVGSHDCIIRATSTILLRPQLRLNVPNFNSSFICLFFFLTLTGSPFAALSITRVHSYCATANTVVQTTCLFSVLIYFQAHLRWKVLYVAGAFFVTPYLSNQSMGRAVLHVVIIWDNTSMA